MACASLGSAAQAATITGLFNTGVDGSGSPLGEGAVDQPLAPVGQRYAGWEPTPTLAGATSGVVYDNPLYHLPSDARFISQLAGGDYTTNPNTYFTTFNVTGDPLTAHLSGIFEADNFATIYLNGHQLAQDVQDTVYENFEIFSTFSATADDFIEGINTLSIVLTDTGKPGAVLIGGLSTVVTQTGVVPEPAAWTLMIGGFGMAGAMLRRRRQSAAATA